MSNIYSKTIFLLTFKEFKRMITMNKKIKALVVLVLIILLCYGIYYLTDYYPASDNTIDLINGSGNVSVINTTNGLLLDGPGCDTALIFYPGAKVEYTSYLPLLMNLSNSGVDCFIVKMPFNLAIINMDSADEIISNNSYNYSNYYMSGHSLGGTSAASYTKKHEDNIKGLILLAAYSTEDINKVPILSVYGSKDNVLNKEKYEDAKKNIHSNYTEYVIDGANHAQFGSYGMQNGDYNATISPDEQIRQTKVKILEFIEGTSS